MAVTVISQPLGHKLTDAEVNVDVSNGLMDGDAWFYVGISHGLSDGDYIYVLSNIESYNGFKVVSVYDPVSFKIRNSPTGEIIAYKQDANDAKYRISILDHTWQCVHLPIVYELYSNLYPSNIPEDTYTPRVVVSQSDNNGYTQLELSTSLTDPTELSWIRLVGTGELAGIYQILTVLQPWSIIINLAYDSTNVFSGYYVAKHYNNYCINVSVYAGLPTGHRWEDEKPFELAATLKLIPDDNNLTKFSISDILRGYINLRNNLTLDTLPNNIDFFVSFFIAYSESYDQSDGDEITTFTGVETQDSLEGFAVNAKLPFKSENISFLSDYVNEDVYLAKWLILQTVPIAVVGRFFDISFILIYSDVDVLILQNGILILTIPNPGLGVIRVPLEFTEAGQFCIQATTAGTPEIPGGETSITLPPVSDGSNIAGPGTNWTAGSNPSVTLTGTSFKKSDPWAIPYSFIAGNTYTLTPDIDYSIGLLELNANIVFALLDSGNNILYSVSSTTLSGSGTHTTPRTFVAPFGSVKYGYYVTTFSSSSASSSFDIDTITGTMTIPTIPAVPAQTLTEEICITVLEECDETFVNEDNIRLTEDGDFRILE